MSFKEMYYYLFYKFYRLLNNDKIAQEQTRIKAAMCIAFLEIWLSFAIINYICLVFPPQGSQKFSPVKISLFVLIIVVKWLAFFRGDAWRAAITRYDKWPVDKNNKGTRIVLWLSVFIILNFIISYFLGHPLMRPGHH